MLVCEHASCDIPLSFQRLGLSEADSQSHIAWDPGAGAVARRMSENLDAALIAATASRLVYDCNRPPDAADAMPVRSEATDIPGNTGLSREQRLERVRTYYTPFRTALVDRIAQTPTPTIVTIHSFTPVYLGQPRAVEIGVLHDSDARLAEAMLARAHLHTQRNVLRNQPYGPEDGVTHTLKEHALPGGYLNVMLEIRNDLLRTEADQNATADMLTGWIVDAFALTNAKGAVKCSA